MSHQNKKDKPSRRRRQANRDTANALMAAGIIATSPVATDIQKFKVTIPGPQLIEMTFARGISGAAETSVQATVISSPSVRTDGFVLDRGEVSTSLESVYAGSRDEFETSEATFGLAKDFVTALPSNARPPEINADPDGWLTFTWQPRRDAVLSASVKAGRDIAFATRLDGESLSGDVSFSGKFPRALRSYLGDIFPA